MLANFESMTNSLFFPCYLLISTLLCNVMCQVPCSRIGHVFRSFHPYQFPEEKDTHAINTARLAHVLMGEYARLYFLYQGKYKEPQAAAIGDLTHRRELLKKLHCHSFAWYLRNVYPEKFVPTEGVRQWGRVRSGSARTCLDNLQLSADAAVGPLGLYPCHERLFPSQMFSLTRKDELRQEDHCAEVTGVAAAGAEVQLTRCHGRGRAQRWLARGSLLRHVDSDLCLTAPRDSSSASLRTCNASDPQQNWTFLPENF